MENQRAETLEQHRREVCNAFARAAAAMRDAANTAENFSNWFSRVNNLQNIPVPPGNATFNLVSNSGDPQRQRPTEPSTSEQTSKKRKVADEPEGKKKRQPKEKKPKDANAPKRPPSMYLLFQNDMRRTIQAQNPDINYAQLLAEIGRIWKGMTTEEKEPYLKSQAVLKAKYEQEKADYEANPVGTAEVSAPVQKTPTTPAMINPIATAAATSGDSSDESTESSLASDEDEDVQEAESTPEPPRKKPKQEGVKKEVAKAPTPPPARPGKKKEKNKKKTTDT